MKLGCGRLILLLLLMIGSGITSDAASGPKDDAPSKNDECYPVVRKHYRFRHLQWSGIFPFEGGFIPDPHCLSSGEMPFPDPIQKLLSTSGVTYKVFDINPFFNDSSSEIILLVRADGRLYEYSLDFPEKQGVQATIASPSVPSIRAFPYHGKIALLCHFFGPAKGIYLVDPAFKSAQTLHLISARSPEFQQIAESFHIASSDASVKKQFCDTTNDFAAFYEKFSGSCGWSPEVYAINRQVYDYDSFWLKD